jgi:hypothetical protein
MRCLIFVNLVLLVTATLSSATYHEVTLQPGPDVGKDSYISTATPSDNFGDELYLRILFYEIFDDRFEAWTLIQFNLDPYMGASVDYATLSLYCFEYESPCVAEVRRITEPWDEHTVTCYNRPGYNWDIVSETTVTSEGWIEVGVTEIVHSWLSGAFTNNGLYILAQVNPELCCAELHSSDFKVADRRPKLEIGCTHTAAAPSSYGAIKAAFR